MKADVIPVEDGKFIDETEQEQDPIKKSQNRIVSIFLLFIVGLVLYITGRGDGIGGFEILIFLFLFANSVYLIYEVYNLLKLRMKRDRESS